jgi:hypothetical protein
VRRATLLVNARAGNQKIGALVEVPEATKIGAAAGSDGNAAEGESGNPGATP